MDGKDAVVDYDRLATEIAAKMPKPQTIDIDGLVAAVIAKLPQAKGCECKATNQPTIDELATAVIAKLPPTPAYFEIQPKR